jgi:hypothetical protein
MEINDNLDVQKHPISILIKHEQVSYGFIYGLVTPATFVHTLITLGNDEVGPDILDITFSQKI